MVPRQDTRRLHAKLCALAMVLCVLTCSGAASAQVGWKRVGTVTTLTNNQLCKTDGQVIICDATTPTISSSSLVGIGTATPQSLLSLYGGGLAVGSYGATTAVGTGSIIASGNLGIGTSLPLVTLDLSKRADALALPSGPTEPSNPINGMIRYNTSLTDVEAYIGGYWTTLTTGGTAASIYLGTGPGVPDPAASANDLTTGLYTIGTGHVDVAVVGTGVADFNGTGLGLGTTSASNKLDVIGGVVIGTQYGGAYNAPPSGLLVQGNVGIGTTSSGSPITIFGTANWGVGEIVGNGTNAEASLGFRPSHNAKGSVGDWIIGTDLGTVSSGSFVIQNQSTPEITILGSGKVGIGTTSPNGTLQVRASTNENFYVGVPYAVSGAVQLAGINDANSTLIPIEMRGSQLTFNGGSVGIGTTSPSANLQVNGVATPVFAIGNTDTAAGGGQINFTSQYANLANTSKIASLITGSPNLSTGGALDFSTAQQTTGTMTNRMHIDALGLVGIGTTSPSNKLDVSGGVAIGASYVGSSTAPANGLIVQGNVGVGTNYPSTALDLFSSGTTTESLRVRNSNNDTRLTATSAVSSLTASGILTFTTGGSEALRIGTSGFVGVGTTAPSNLLDVSGGVAIGTQYVGVTTAPTSGLLVQGNVGIGTTSPRNTLDVNGTGIYIASGVPTGTTNALYNSSGVLTWNGQALGTAGNSLSGGVLNYVPLWTGATSLGTSNIYQSGGNVGIGTTSPAQLVDIRGGNFQVGSNATSPFNSIILNGGNTTTAASTNVNRLRYGGNDSGSGYFTIQGPGNADYLTINSGNVGIGTTSPANGAKLDVNGNFNIDGSGTSALLTMLRNGAAQSSAPASYTANDSAQLSFYQIGSVGAYQRFLDIVAVGPAAGSGGPNTSNIRFFTSSSTTSGYATEAMRVSGTGLVGIGTTSPLSTLSVNGGAAIGASYAGISTASPGNLIVSGAIGVGTSSPSNTLDVNGGTVIGTQYAGATTASASGLTVQGNVAIGTTSPAANIKADIAGPVKIAGSGSEPCTAAQVGAMRYNPTGNYFELCSYP